MRSFTNGCLFLLNFTGMNRNRLIIIGLSAALVLLALIYWIFLRGGSDGHHRDDDIAQLEPEKSVLYGIEYDEGEITILEGVIESGQTISTIFNKYGISPAMIDRTAKAAEDVFSLRKIKAGNKYTAFLTADSLSQLRYFVYEDNVTDYLVIAYQGDSVAVRKEHKDVTVERRMGEATINSSLWNAMVDGGMSYALIKDLEDNIYGWTIDFFGLQKGDHLTVIYDERSVEGQTVGAGRIWGAIFHHNGKDYYAIPYKQDGKIQYWDENGNSLRKSMLKAPLEFTRISSKFSPSRLHPVLKIRRPHYGVDYAAPSGTPVRAVADGVVTFRGWDSKGGGNTIKIKHSRDLQTGYLHLRGFAKGLTTGKRVSQGEIIGYVGSTGTSTGPHLDYRVWRGGKPIDPLKITSEPGDPISKGNREGFEFVKERILAELKGELADSLRITQLDSLTIAKPVPAEAPVQ